ncbi:MAG: small basic protein [Candidatus Omnitrophota bacterium]
MSMHPSLALSDKNKKQQSVLKRTERLRILMEKGKWKEGDSVYGLPKLKTVRIKIKKEKAEKTETAATPAAAPAAAESKQQPAAKGAAAKGAAAGKAQEKK